MLEELVFHRGAWVTIVLLPIERTLRTHEVGAGLTLHRTGRSGYEKETFLKVRWPVIGGRRVPRDSSVFDESFKSLLRSRVAWTDFAIL